MPDHNRDVREAFERVEQAAAPLLAAIATLLPLHARALLEANAGDHPRGFCFETMSSSGVDLLEQVLPLLQRWTRQVNSRHTLLARAAERAAAEATTEPADTPAGG
jgi:hypothetical protein